MNLEQFFNQWNGKFAEFDNIYPNQCVDLIKYYNRDIVGYPAPTSGNGWQIYDTASPEYYMKIHTPQKGDIAVWKKEFGGYGHVAVVWDNNQFFSQNYPIGAKCSLQTIPTDKIRGYLRPLKFNNMTNYAQKFNGQTVITSQDGTEKGKWYWVINGEKRLIPDRKTAWAFGLLEVDVHFISHEAIASMSTGMQLKYWDGPYYRFIEEIVKHKKEL